MKLLLCFEQILCIAIQPKAFLSSAMKVGEKKLLAVCMVIILIIINLKAPKKSETNQNLEVEASKLWVFSFDFLLAEPP